MVYQIIILEGPDKGKNIPITGNAVLIGRDSTRCQMVLSDDEASRQHARLTTDASGNIWVEDLGSSNGTLLNGQSIKEVKQIRMEDRLQIGENIMALGPAVQSPVVSAAAAPKVTGSISIGRNPSNDLIINDPKVSREHARIDVHSGTYYLTNLSSGGGTFLNGQEITAPTILPSASYIQILDHSYFFDGSRLLNQQGEQVAALSPAMPVEDGKVSYSKAFSAPFSGSALFRWLLGSILAVIPIIGFLANGYRCKLLKSGQSRSFQLPAWSEWKELFVTGTKFFLLRVIYYALPLIYFLLVLFFAPPAPTETWLGLLGYLRGWLLLFGLIALFITWCIVPMALANFAATGSIESSVRARSMVQLIRKNQNQYISLLLTFAGLWLTMGLIIALFPYVGIVLGIFSAFYLYSVSSLLFGEFYGRNGNQPDNHTGRCLG
ncbi:MAG: FHA domain-containing protein [Tindallia sp. MSAO_Bac2]|nr:MAG: FHA domain-containing protein [Tindallia sp. MSAO_Bac2]